MKISVIITVYNRFKYVENILKCLSKQTIQPHEVIFTDDGSEENLKVLLLKYKKEVDFKIKYIYQENLGFRKARACNNGVLESEGEYLIFLDQDAIFPEDLIEKFIYKQKEKYFSILRVIWSTYDEMLKIQAKIDENKDYIKIINQLEKKHFIKLKKWLLKDKYNNLRYKFKLRNRGTGLMGIGFGILKEDYIKVNGYDEDFKGWGGEDADLGLRLYYLGLKSITFSTKKPAIHMCHPLDPTKVSNKDNNKTIYERKKIEIVKGNYKCLYGLDNRKDLDRYVYEEI